MDDTDRKEQRITQLEAEIAYMQSSKFWRARTEYVHWRQFRFSQAGLHVRQAGKALVNDGPEGFMRYCRYIWDIVDRKYIHRRAASATPVAVIPPRVSTPHSEYNAWRKQLPQLSKAVAAKDLSGLAYQPLISIITPVYNTDPRWLEACITSVKNQFYPRWELCIADDGSTNTATRELLDRLAVADQRIKVKRHPARSGIAAASNTALSLATGEFIGLLDHDDELTPDALVEVVQLLNQRRNADMIYSDEDKLELDGRLVEPFFKPDWAPEYFLSCMYTGHFGVYRKSLIDQIGGFRSQYDKSQDYDLVLRLIDHTQAIYHIPKVLYHWRKIPGSTAVAATEKDLSDAPALRAVRDYLKRNQRDAEVIYDPITTYHRIKYRLQDEPLVSILLPTNGQIITNDSAEQIDLLQNCLTSIETKTTYPNYEIVIGHNGNLQPGTLAFVQERMAASPQRYQLHYYKYEEPFNFANKLNFIASKARGDYFVILNDDIEILTADWMSALLEYAQQDDIGVVGAKLYYPDSSIQHAGVVMGIGGGASHVFLHFPHDAGGYFGMAKVVRNYSVVTGACCMTKASLFRELGGLDEAFRIDYNDVDYNLRVRAKGYRVVFTPFAELTHHESVSLGTRAGKTDRPEERLLRSRWAEVIAKDPYYNPNLTLRDINFDLT